MRWYFNGGVKIKCDSMSASDSIMLYTLSDLNMHYRLHVVIWFEHTELPTEMIQNWYSDFYSDCS